MLDYKDMDLNEWVSMMVEEMKDKPVGYAHKCLLSTSEDDGLDIMVTVCRCKEAISK